MSTKAKKSVEKDPFASIGEALETAAERFEEGASNARKSAQHATDSAKRAADSAKKAINTGLYNGSFGISYGIIYATVFVTEMLPKDSVIRRGLEDGADAAFEAYEKPTVPAESDTETGSKRKRSKKSKEAVQESETSNGGESEK